MGYTLHTFYSVEGSVHSLGKEGNVLIKHDKKLWERILAPWESCPFNETNCCMRSRLGFRLKYLTNGLCMKRNCPDNYGRRRECLD